MVWGPWKESHVGAAGGTNGDGAVVAAEAEVAVAAALQAVPPAVAVVEFRSSTREEARIITHQVVRWAIARLKNLCTRFSIVSVKL